MKVIKDITFYVMSKDEKIAKCVIRDGELISIDKYAKEIYDQPFYGENTSLEYVMSFLEDRVVNRNKYNINEILASLGLDHYDMIDILRKTHGVSYDDFTWIKFEGENISYKDVRVR